jgi:ribosomal protein S20
VSTPPGTNPPPLDNPEIKMRKSLIATLALGTSLAIGAVGVTAALPNIAGAQTTPTTQSAPSTTQNKTGHPGLRALRRHEFKVAADTIGVKPAELRTDLKNGQSIADVAAAKNVPVDNVITAVVNDASARIDKAVTNGKLDQAKADTMKSKLTDRVTKLVNAHKGDHTQASAQGN